MSGRYTVLVIDDDQAIHDVLGFYLRDAGLEVRDALLPSRGLEEAAAQPPDLVLLDLQMPEMDGFAAYERLRAIPSCTDVPVIFLTALSQTHLKVKGLEAGADDYVTKPFDRAEVLARVKAALRRSERYRRSAALEGSLGEVTLADLLQTLDLGGKAATVTLPSMDGEIALRAGHLLTARQGSRTGRDALERLLLLGEGRFEVGFQVGAAGPTQGPLVHALMDALVNVDTAREVLGPLPARLRVAAGAPGPLATLGAQVWSPARLVAALAGPLGANAELVARAFRDGQLTQA